MTSVPPGTSTFTFLPDTLPNPFCVKNYSEISKIRGMDAYSIVKTLLHIGLLEIHGNLGKAVAYRIRQRPLDEIPETPNEKNASAKAVKKSSKSKKKADG